MGTRIPLHVSLSAPDGPAVAARGLGAWLTRTAPATARGHVSVAIVSDRRMRALNRMFRGKDAATDVLSFPVQPEGEPPGGRHAALREPRSLGDIVIAAGVAAKQAKEQGHSLSTELRVLALHGLLHLLGFDHESDDGRMARTELRLRKKGGLPSGLIDRAGTAQAVPRQRL
jgi:probable rRNA maturation factor